jgi:hypothetical protein
MKHLLAILLLSGLYVSMTTGYTDTLPGVDSALFKDSAGPVPTPATDAATGVLSPIPDSARITEAAEGVKIVGSPAFVAATKEALVILKKSGHLDGITPFIEAIHQSRCSGMDVYKKVYEVGDPTWQKDVVWYAGTIAHDSHHSKLYADAKKARNGMEPAYSAWSGAKAETKCLAYQREVLKALKASASTLAYVRELAKNPTYQNIGKDKQDVCSDRNW